MKNLAGIRMPIYLRLLSSVPVRNGGYQEYNCPRYEICENIFFAMPESRKLLIRQNDYVRRSLLLLSSLEGSFTNMETTLIKVAIKSTLKEVVPTKANVNTSTTSERID
jgi:hypothetical protein